MKAVVYQSPGHSVTLLLDAMAEGMSRHGVAIDRFRDRASQAADFAVTWGWRTGRRIRSEGFEKPILVMERGYLGDRMKMWTSLGWDGLNGRARFPLVQDQSRFESHFGNVVQPWKGGDYALLVGQVKGDTALIDVNIMDWYRRTASALIAQGWHVRFRQHPREVELHHQPTIIEGTEYSKSTLADDLAGAAIAVTYSSNTGCDAMLAGVPVHAEDVGSMVYPIASHDLSVLKPDRIPHLSRLAWCQWQTEELRSGEAWEVVRTVM